MAQTKVQWKKELAQLVASAKDPKEKAAVEAFAKALGPHLEKPELLRTLLSKIQRQAQIAVVVAQGKFDSEQELRARTPKGVNVITL